MLLNGNSRLVGLLSIVKTFVNVWFIEAISEIHLQKCLDCINTLYEIERKKKIEQITT